MFPQFKKLNDESGIVLFIVLMTAIIIMIFSVGILTQSMNEINYAQQQIDQIASEQLAKGIFWNAYNGASTSSLQSITTSQTLGGRNYIISITPGPNASGTTSYNVVANYDTF